MTLAQIRTLVLSYLDDPDAGYFTNAQTLVWINNAQREVQKMLGQAFEGHFLKCVKTTMVVGQREYQLPSDFKRLHRLEIVVSGTTSADEVLRRVAKITRNQQDKTFNNRGFPEFYYFQGNYLVVVPASDTAYTLRLYYEYRLTDLSDDSDSSDIPAEHQEMIAVIAAIDGMIKDGRDASLLLKKKEDFEKMLKQDAEQRNADEPRTVVQTISDDYEEIW
jgi:hypothetical protein